MWRLKLSPVQFSCTRLQLALEYKPEAEGDYKKFWRGSPPRCGNELCFKEDWGLSFEELDALLRCVYVHGCGIKYGWTDEGFLMGSTDGPIRSYVLGLDQEVEPPSVYMLVVSPRDKCFGMCDFCYVDKLGEVKHVDSYICESAGNAVLFLLRTLKWRHHGSKDRHIDVTVAIGGHCDPALFHLHAKMNEYALWYGDSSSRQTPPDLSDIVDSVVQAVKEHYEEQAKEYIVGDNVYLTFTTSFPDRLLDVLDDVAYVADLRDVFAGVAVSLKLPSYAKYCKVVYLPKDLGNYINEIIDKYRVYVCLQFLCVAGNVDARADVDFIDHVVDEVKTWNTAYYLHLLPLRYREVPNVPLRELPPSEAYSRLIRPLAARLAETFRWVPSNLFLFDMCMVSKACGRSLCAIVQKWPALWHLSIEQQRCYAPAPCPLGGPCRL